MHEPEFGVCVMNTNKKLLGCIKGGRGKTAALAACAIVAGAALIVPSGAVQARVFIGVGLNFGVPVFRAPVYCPPPVVYTPPPTIVYAPPPVIYQPAPVVTAPAQTYVNTPIAAPAPTYYPPPITYTPPGLINQTPVPTPVYTTPLVPSYTPAYNYVPTYTQPVYSPPIYTPPVCVAPRFVYRPYYRPYFYHPVFRPYFYHPYYHPYFRHPFYPRFGAGIHVGFDFH